MVVYLCRIRLSCHLLKDCCDPFIPLKGGRRRLSGWATKKKSPKESKIFETHQPSTWDVINGEHILKWGNKHTWTHWHVSKEVRTSHFTRLTRFHKYVCWKANEEPNGSKRNLRNRRIRIRIRIQERAYEKITYTDKRTARAKQFLENSKLNFHKNNKRQFDHLQRAAPS